MSFRPSRTAVLVVAAAALVAGCEDPFAPEPTPVPAPQSFVLRDFRAGPLTDASAFDLFSASPVRVDQSEGWDFVFYVTEEGEAQLRPRSMIIGGSSSAGIQEVSDSFAGLLEAPEEGYTTDAAVTASPDAVYALRSRRSNSCSRFGKMTVDSVEVAEGRLFATTVVNPNCNDRSVEPDVDPDDDGSGDGDDGDGSG